MDEVEIKLTVRFDTDHFAASYDVDDWLRVLREEGVNSKHYRDLAPVPDIEHVMLYVENAISIRTMARRAWSFIEVDFFLTVKPTTHMEYNLRFG